MTRLGVRALKADLCRRIDRVARRDEVLIVTRRGRDVAAVVPLGVLQVARQVGRAMPTLASATAGLRDPGAVLAAGRSV